MIYTFHTQILPFLENVKLDEAKFLFFMFWINICFGGVQYF